MIQGEKGLSLENKLCYLKIIRLIRRNPEKTTKIFMLHGVKPKEKDEYVDVRSIRAAVSNVFFTGPSHLYKRKSQHTPSKGDPLL